MRVHRETPLFKGQAGLINCVYTYSTAYTSHAKFSFYMLMFDLLNQ